MKLIFFNKMFFEMGSSESTLADLRQYLTEKYKKDIVFETEFREKNSFRKTKFVSMDEIKSVINADIIIED